MLFLQLFGDGQAEMCRVAIRDHAQVAARPADTGFPERNFEVFRHKTGCFDRVILRFRFEKDGKTLRTYAGAQQSCRIIGKRRIDDAGSRNGGQRPFNRLRVVEPSADITARCQAECQVRGELSVASPVFVCTFDILLDGRPEVVGKFGSFHHDMYFRVEAAHAVGRAYNVVFGNGSIEDTLRSELLLHAFGDVEHAAFVFVGHVLSPQECIRVMAEFCFQCFVDCGYQCFLFAIFFFVCAVCIFLRQVRFGQDIVKDRCRIGFGSRHRFAVGCAQVFFCLCFYLLQFLFGQAVVTEQHTAEFLQRIGCFHVGKFVFIAIQSLLVGVRMGADAHAVCMDDHRIMRIDRMFAGFGHGVHRVENVFSVAVDDAQVLEA